MRSSLLAILNCIGSITMMHYFYLNYPNWCWNASVSILILAVFSVLVLHFRKFLAVGSAGTVMFLLNIQDSLFWDIFDQTTSLFVSIALAVFVAIITEYLVSTKLTIFNIIFDIIFAMLTVLLIDRISNTLALPIGLIVFFLLVICFNFDACYRKEKISTKSKLFSSSSKHLD